MNIQGKTADQIRVEVEERENASNEFPQSFNPDRTRIDVSQQDLSALTAQCWQAIKQQNGDAAAKVAPRLFLFHGVMVRAAKDDSGRLKVEPVTLDMLGNILDDWAEWYVMKKVGKEWSEVPVFPSERVLRNVMATAEPDLPVLRRIVGVPIFTDDGRLNLDPGFDWASGIYYCPTRGFDALPVPDVITLEDVNAANVLLCCDLLVDFPFAVDGAFPTMEEKRANPDIVRQSASRDNAVALAVLGAVREMIQESTPNHLITASLRSSGKGKLARALLGIFAGDRLASTPPLEKENEWREMIVSKLLSGAPAVLIDNVEQSLRSPSLCVAFTEPYWESRLFHKQAMAFVPVRCIWAMTANNPHIHEDIVTRSIEIRLEPQTPHPERRDKWTHPDIDSWCKDHRPELVRAVHVLVKWWLQCGRPSPESLESTRHSEWCRIVGGILQCAGYKDFLKNQRDFQQASTGDEVSMMSGFADDWYKWAQRPGAHNELEINRRMNLAPTSELWSEVAEKLEDFPRSKAATGQTRALGVWLSKLVGRQIEGTEGIDGLGRSVTRTYLIRRHNKQITGGVTPWRIEVVREVFRDDE